MLRSGRARLGAARSSWLIFMRRGLRTSLSASGFGAQMNDEDPAIIEHEKKIYDRGKIPAVIMEVRGWSEKLATDSEAAVKADRHVRDVAFAVLQADSVAALREAEIFDTYCADCEPVSYLSGAPVVQRKGFRPLSRILKGWKRGR